MPMTLDAFRTLVESHGPDKASWPESVRADAEELMLNSADARHELAEALTRQDTLHTPPEATPPPDLLDRICAAIKGDEPSGERS